MEGQAAEEGAELVRRFRRGDEAAFRTLFERYGGLASLRIARRLPGRLRRKVSVADVLQDSLLAAFDCRDDLREDSEAVFRSWLLSIVESKAIDAIRRFERVAKRDARREVTRGEREATSAYSGRDASPSQVALGAEVQGIALDAMRHLPPDYREVLRLTRYEHLTIGEAAERMGRSREAAKKLYARAMDRFQAEFLRLGGREP